MQESVCSSYLHEERESCRPQRFWIFLLLASGFLGLLILIMTRSAWVCDDAFITFRVVDNFWNGHGLRWNVAERVCVFTHPLYLLLLLAIHPLSGELYYSSIFLGLLLSSLAIGLVFVGFSSRIPHLVLVFGLLASSKAFVDFSTSGLENPLLYLLLSVFYWLVFRRNGRSDRDLFALGLTASLSVLTRMDTILLYAPLLLLTLWQARRLRCSFLLFLAFTPFLAWEIFSLVYYGSLVPNTYHAKLSTGLPSSYYLGEGSAYLVDSLRMDPVTLPVICAAIILAFLSRRRSAVAAALGLACYLLYTVRVGGDFMSGRFFALPFLGAVVLCSTALAQPLARRGPLLAIAVAILALTASLLHPLSPLRSGASYDWDIRPSLQRYARPGKSTADERAFYYPTNGLLRASVFPSMPAHVWRAQGEGHRNSGSPLVISEVVGMLGFYAGPGVHVVDRMGLGDFFLSRAPVRRDTSPRIGHMIRDIPGDYLESLRQGGNRFEDPGMGELYDALVRIHRGPVWSTARWRDIWRLNTGSYDHCFDTALPAASEERTIER